MKNLFLLAIIATTLIFGCQPERNPYRNSEVVSGKDKKVNDSTVRVVNSDGSHFLMSYMLYSALMSSGGRENVIHHYHNNAGSLGLSSAPKGFGSSNHKGIDLNKKKPAYYKATSSKVMPVSKTYSKPSNLSTRSFKLSSPSVSKRTFGSSFRRSSFSSSRRR